MNSWVESLSDGRLQGYEDIVSQISGELERHEELKKEIENEDNKIIAFKLSQFKQKQSISLILVKIFNSIFEIHNLYEGSLQHNDFVNLAKLQEDFYKFYLIEICLASCMIQKLLKYKCKLHICVQTDTEECINKIRTLDSKNIKVPIVDVIPVKSNIKKCRVQCFLTIQFENHQNVTINLNSVEIDISYHLESGRNTDKYGNLDDDFLNISNLYKDQHNFNLDLTGKRMRIQAQILLKNLNNKTDIITPLTKNCYHQVDLEQFSKFCKDPNENVLNLNFCVDSTKIGMSYNHGTRILKIKCNYRFLQEMKKLFLNLSHTNLQLDKVQNLIERSSVPSGTLGDSIVLYKDTRKIFL